MMANSATRERFEVELSRAGYELARAKAAYEASIARAAAAGLTQRAIASLAGTNQASVSRIVGRAVDKATDGSHEARPEARFRHELHRAIAAHIGRGDWSPADARDRLEKSARSMTGPDAELWLSRWRELLDGHAAALIDAILDDGDAADDLRQVSPLVGIATADERAGALARAYRR